MSDGMSVKKNVGYPFLQAVGIGFLIGVMFFFILRAWGREAINTSAAIWFGTAAVIFWFFSYVSYPKQKQVKAMETVQPRVYNDIIRTTLYDDTDIYPSGSIIEIEVDRVKFCLMCQDILDGLKEIPPEHRMTYRNFSGSGKLFSRNKYEVIRSALIKGHVFYHVVPGVPTQGIRPSRAGIAYLNFYANIETETSSLLNLTPFKLTNNRLQSKSARASTHKKFR